ncbi:DUF1194 domain-containing protein [Rhizobiales bacterium]|uniref:DUF1194 domain-containing protein n=1 Tax=Hongsoonwoonella zoysiae TaxID=2821844 RepID=UPI0015609A89|nr:DUF1194 domain-containing protein [Hongsoonwoonella zoysiae]NRG18785.1 DUF1194 domain-containing protein [Hongsoonwoonella zoysiae]
MHIGRFAVSLKRALTLCISLAVAAYASIAPAQSAREVDLQLVLAIDASASVDPQEYQLQLDGIAAAFRDIRVHQAISAGDKGAIAVAIIVWAESGTPADESGWYLVSGSGSANRFAGDVSAWPRHVNGGTGIGAGLVQAMRMFDRNGYTSVRRTVDVSGDGRETPPRDYVVLVENARGMALSRGITINGLAIENEDKELSAYYLEKVATGPKSFVVRAGEYEDFAQAMLRKLLREIEDLPLSASLE